MLTGDLKKKLKEVQKLRKQKKYNEALALLDNIDNEESSIETGVAAYAYYQKGLILGSLNKIEEAKVSFKKAISFSQSTSQRKIIESGDFKIRKMYLDAYFLLKKLGEEKGTESSGMTKVLIDELLKNTDLKIAINIIEKFNNENYSSELKLALEKLIEKNPDDLYLWSVIGKFYIHGQEYEKALDAYKKGCGSPIKKFESILGIIHCHVLFENYNKAKEYIDTAKKIAISDKDIKSIERFEKTVNLALKNTKTQTTIKSKEPSSSEFTILHSTDPDLMKTVPPPPPEDEISKVEKKDIDSTETKTITKKSSIKHSSRRRRRKTTPQDKILSKKKPEDQSSDIEKNIEQQKIKFIEHDKIEDIKTVTSISQKSKYRHRTQRELRKFKKIKTVVISSVFVFILVSLFLLGLYGSKYLIEFLKI